MDSVYDLYQRGLELLENGHFHAAIVPLSLARDQEPGKASIRDVLTHAEYDRGKWKRSK